MKKRTYHILLAFMRHINKPENQCGYYGLCTSLNLSLIRSKFDLESQILLDTELKNLFEKLGLDKRYPFNRSYDDYFKEAHNCTIFQNPKRLAFISSFLSGEYRHLITP